MFSPERQRFIRSWLRALLTGNPVECRNVAASYALGEGISRNEKRARRWYSKIAAAGDLSAQYDLGLMMLEGEGGPIELEKGRELMFRAGAFGDPMAQKLLAYVHRDGKWGFPISLEEAEKWKRLAEARGMAV